MRDDSHSRSQIQRIRDWLAAEPAAECLDDLAAWQAQLKALLELDTSMAERSSCIGGLAARLLDISDRFKPRLLAATLPLAREVHAGVLDIVRSLHEVGLRFDVDEEREALDEDAVVEAAAWQMRLVGEAFLLSCMGGVEPPHPLWKTANRLLLRHDRLIEALAPGQALSPSVGALLGAYKRMLATAVLQPESLTARELAWVHDYLDVVAGATELSWRPLQPESSVFWLNAREDNPPVAQVRRPPLGTGRVLFFSALALAKRVHEQIEWLEARIAEAEVVGIERDGELLESDSSGLPLGLTPVEVLSLLHRMHERWATPQTRDQPRRRKLYTVQVCKGLREIWRMHKRGRPGDEVSEWMVYNESPGGYAIISVGGVHGVISAGMALALRRGIGEPWSICVVRWVRSDKPEEVELGLQVVSESCVPVSVAFRGASERTTTPALLLPPREGRRNNAIMSPAGTYASRRFVMVRETGQLYVAQGRVQSLDMQTANIELYQYEIDPYPI
ncbi:MAG TPA: hypothetical protein PLN31_01750 [Azoarcus taiwanensis]|nr:hypothetical protein [Azoarcus taiwanensis]